MNNNNPVSDAFSHPLLDEYLAAKPPGGPLRIGLVGGPNGGKSTVMGYVARQFPGLVSQLDETATLFLTSGLTAVPSQEELIDRWLSRFQPAMLLTQIMRELEAYDEAVLKGGIRAIVSDRGTADAMVYMPGLHDELAARFSGLTTRILYAAYDKVVHLESLATAKPELFSAQGNDKRYENLEKAQRVEMLTREAWQGHPDYHFIPGANGIEYVVGQVDGILRPILT